MRETLKTTIGKKEVFFILLAAFIYIIFTSYIMNYRLVLSTFFGTFPISYKFILLATLIGGVYTGLSKIDFFLLIGTSFLVGLNFVLLFLTVKNIRQNSRVGLVVGGASVLSLAAAGCTSCGLSVLSILGFSTALAILPFDGLTVHFVSIILLLFSTFYMLKKLQSVCKIPSKK